MADVDVAPDALWLSRRKPDREAVVVELLSYAVDPAAAEDFVERLRVGDATLARVFPVKADSQLVGARVILLQPALERVGRTKELQLVAADFHLRGAASLIQRATGEGRSSTTRYACM